MKTKDFDSIESALAALKAGEMIIVVDDDNRENEGDLIIPAEKITPEKVNFMAQFGRGMICAPLTETHAKKLQLPLQVSHNTSAHGTAFTITIDAKENISTGISASDRAHTLKLLATSLEAEDFVRPGHIFPLIAKDGGVLSRDGHTEAAVDLSRLSGHAPVGVICEIMNPDGSMSRLPELIELKKQHNLKLISIADLKTYRLTHEDLISEHEVIPFEHRYGEFNLHIFRSEILKQEHIALVKGDPKQWRQEPVIRLHSECLTGDVFGSVRCDCGAQLDRAMKMIETHGSGALLYLKQEGRGIGLFNKIKAYKLQDTGLDTVEANLKLGHQADARDYSLAAMMLKRLGITTGKILTNNPSKISSLTKLGLKNFTMENMPLDAHAKNRNYLMAKKDKLGHQFNEPFIH
jgi:3,4-dihydroxy 2-butanone 4-phosphate synthase / GTP cyclohydrolase II